MPLQFNPFFCTSPTDAASLRGNLYCCLYILILLVYWIVSLSIRTLGLRTRYAQVYTKQIEVQNLRWVLFLIRVAASSDGWIALGGFAAFTLYCSLWCHEWLSFKVS